MIMASVSTARRLARHTLAGSSSDDDDDGDDGQYYMGGGGDGGAGAGAGAGAGSFEDAIAAGPQVGSEGGEFDDGGDDDGGSAGYVDDYVPGDVDVDAGGHVSAHGIPEVRYKATVCSGLSLSLSCG